MQCLRRLHTITDAALASRVNPPATLGTTRRTTHTTFPRCTAGVDTHPPRWAPPHRPRPPPAAAPAARGRTPTRCCRTGPGRGGSRRDTPPGCDRAAAAASLPRRLPPPYHPSHCCSHSHSHCCCFRRPRGERRRTGVGRGHVPRCARLWTARAVVPPRQHSGRRRSGGRPPAGQRRTPGRTRVRVEGERGRRRRRRHHGVCRACRWRRASGGRRGQWSLLMGSRALRGIGSVGVWVVVDAACGKQRGMGCRHARRAGRFGAPPFNDTRTLFGVSSSCCMVAVLLH